MQQACPYIRRAPSGKDLGASVSLRAHPDMVGSTFFAGVAVPILAAPFELTAPLVRLSRQSISSVEAAVLFSFVCAAGALVVTRRTPQWQTPLTAPWIALLVMMLVASAVSPVSRLNAFHMTGRMTAAFGIYLLAFNGVTTSARLRRALPLSVAVGVGVSILAILEYRGVRSVLAALRTFRPAVSTVGAQVRAGGPLAYPTIASMYLEVVFAFGLGLMLAQLDAARHRRVALLFVALATIAEAIVLTFTRAGLITMATSLLLVAAVDRRRRGTARGGLLLGGLAFVSALLFAGARSAASLWLRPSTEGRSSWYRAAIVAPPHVELSPGRLARVPITFNNTGALPWDSHATPPVLVSYHWLPASGDAFVAFEGERT